MGRRPIFSNENEKAHDPQKPFETPDDALLDFLFFDKQKFSASWFRSKAPVIHQRTQMRSPLNTNAHPAPSFHKVFWDLGVKLSTTSSDDPKFHCVF